MNEPLSAGVLVLSDKGARGEREDQSGLYLREVLEKAGFRVVSYLVLPDEYEDILVTLIDWVDRKGLDLIITSGGTGLSPRDVTPEATRAALEKEVPGIAEAIRGQGLKHTPRAMLSRGVAGVRKKTLIINFPGSLKAVQESWAVVAPVLGHALAKIRGEESDCAR